MVRALSAAGAGVVAADRDEQGLGETCEGLTDVIPVVADVSAAAGAAGIVGTAVRALGRLDYAASR
jgi:NAD(P)-dependent dehydrogenase (short-subunit alcohol dehydrogenase family)